MTSAKGKSEKGAMHWPAREVGIFVNTHTQLHRGTSLGTRGDVGGTRGTWRVAWDVWDHRNETSVTCRLHALIPENRLPIEECLSNLTCRTVVCACRWAYERMPKELWSTHRKNCAKSELEVKHPEKIVRTCRCAKSFCAFCLRNSSFLRPRSGPRGMRGDVGGRVGPPAAPGPPQ